MYSTTQTTDVSTLNVMVKGKPTSWKFPYLMNNLPHQREMKQEKLHPIDISVMFNDGTMHTFENAMYYETYGADSRYIFS